jgi:hypothetical protein
MLNPGLRPSSRTGFVSASPLFFEGTLKQSLPPEWVIQGGKVLKICQSPDIKNRSTERGLFF